MSMPSITQLSIASQHAFHKVAERSPEILAAGQLVLVNEQDVVFEAGVEMWLKTEVYNYVVVMAVDVGVHTVQTLENLSKRRLEVLGKRNTDAAGKHLLIVNIALYPCHQVLNVFWCWHLGGLFEVFIVLP